MSKRFLVLLLVSFLLLNECTSHKVALDEEDIPNEPTETIQEEDTKSE